VRANGVPQGDLIDTSALLALVRQRDPWHQPCVASLRSVSFPLVTTTAVLTEVFYFAIKWGGLVEPVWEFIRSGRIKVASILGDDLPALEALMFRYADRPMDFADATLVHVAEREGLRTILTIDHDDFETYRIGRNAKFRILPERIR
jgi:predicted nucleic acid-binding protein